MPTQIEDLGPADPGIEDLGPAQPQSLSQQILARRAARGEPSPQEELGKINFPRSALLPADTADEGIKQTLRQSAATLPIILGGVGGAAAEGALASTLAAGLGGAGGEGWHQVVQHLTQDPEAPQSGNEAAGRMGTEGAEQAAFQAAPRMVGRFFGSSGLPQAKATVAQAERSGVDPNLFSYNEASDNASPTSIIENYVNRKSGMGRFLQKSRATKADAAIDAAEKSTKDQVSLPFEQGLEDADKSGKTFDTSKIVNAATNIQTKIAKEGTELSPKAQKLLERALKFNQGSQGRVGGMKIPLPGKPAQATPYQIRGFREEVSDALTSPEPDVRRVARNLEESSREADDQILPPGTRENYHQFKQDFGPASEEGSLRSKSADYSEGMPTFFSALTSPATNAAAPVLHAFKKLPIKAKIGLLQALEGRMGSNAISTGLRGLQVNARTDDSDAPRSPYARPEPQTP